MKENEKEKCPLYAKNLIYFMDTGRIEFKGVDIATCEAIFKKEDRYKEKFGKELVSLFGSIKDNNWEQKIFSDLMVVLIKAAQSMPEFTLKPSHPINNMQSITNVSFVQLCRMANKAYAMEEDYAGAMHYLNILVDLINDIPPFDRLLLEYLLAIKERYEMLLIPYLETIDNEINAHPDHIFNESHVKAWHASKNAVTIYEKLKAMGRKSSAITKKKALWYSLIKQNSDKMVFILHSGKK